MNRNSKPQVVRRGSVAVKVYTVNNRSGDMNYVQFVVAWRDADGRRRLRKFSNEQEAQTEAELVATKLASGEAEVLSLTNSDRTQYLHARSLSDGLGIPLVSALEDYVAAKRLLPSGTTLVSAIEFFKSRQQGNDMPVSKAVQLYLASLKLAGCGERHMEDTKGRMEAFAEAFAMPMTGLNLENVRAYVFSLGNTRKESKALALRTRWNHFKAIRTFLRHAVKQRWVSKGWLEDLEAFGMPKLLRGEIKVFCPAELAKLIEASELTFLPYLVIGAFSGLRTAEILRLDWGNVDFEDGYIEVSEKNAKVKGCRRLVPMSDNLKAWLKPMAKEHGPVLTKKSLLDFQRNRVAKKTGIRWKANGLRHSFISYRCAITKNVAQVSYEAGNTPSIIHRHYLKVRKEVEALAWFGIKPPVPCESVPEPSELRATKTEPTV